jgi:hypothetical protein
MQRKKAAAPKPAVAPNVSEDKLAMIRSGKKKKTITGFKENKNITFENKGGKFVMVEKEKKFEEAGVTKKKRNFIMFESKLGTEKETDMTKIAGAKKLRAVEPRQEEKIVQTKKRKEYLDNYQYHETKELKPDTKPSVVIHERLGDIVGGTVETSTYEKQTTVTDPSGRQQVLRQKQTNTTKQNRSGATETTTKREMAKFNTTSNVRNRPNASAKPGNTETEVTKVRRTRVTKDGKTTSTTEVTRGKK